MENIKDEKQTLWLKGLLPKPIFRSKVGVRHVANLMSYKCLGDPGSDLRQLVGHEDGVG